MQKLLSIIAALLLVSFIMHAQEVEQTNKLKTSFDKLDIWLSDYEIVTLDLTDNVFDLKDRGFTELKLSKRRMTYRMKLYRRDILSPDYVSSLSRVDKDKYLAIPTKGYTNSGQTVSLTVGQDFLYGLIGNGEDQIQIQPLRFFREGAEHNKFVVFYTKDILENEEGICGTTEAHHIQTHANSKSKSNQKNSGQCLQLELAIASDFSMFQKYGSVVDVENRNIGVVNNVQTNYDDEFDDQILISIVEQFVSNCSSCDPWTSSTVSNELLIDFTGWAPTGFSATHDMGQLWSDRNFNGNTIGLAWVGTVCSNARYHIVQDFSSNAGLIRVLMAHEMGHNFSAIHDSNGSAFIMAPTVSTSTQWSSQSVQDIDNFVNTIDPPTGCLDHCPASISANFSIGPSAICEENVVHFYDLSIGQITDYEWNFPGGNPTTSSDPNPKVEYFSAGSYDVTLTIFGQGGTTDEITVNDAVIVGGAGNEILIYEDFEDGLGDWTADNNGTGWGLITVQGSRFGSQAIHVNNPINPPNTVETLNSPLFSLLGYTSARLRVQYAYAELGSASDSLVVDISVDGGNTFQTVEGFFGSSLETAPSQSSLFMPSTPSDWCGPNALNACLDVNLDAFVGANEVQLRIRNRTLGGNAIYINRVWVETDCYDLGPPTADFTANQTEVCAPGLIQFMDQSTDQPIQWEWEFPGGTPSSSTEQNPEVVYNVPGRYNVRLTVSNPAGFDTKFESDFVFVRDVPIADFSFSVSNDTVVFTNESIDADTYMWDFGDGATSMEENPQHIYPSNGSFSVNLTASNVCGTDPTDQIVFIEVPPTAEANPTTAEICATETVSFSAAGSVGASSVEWLFEGGSPQMSTNQNQVVRYDSAGIFDVVLIASNPYGTDTMTLTDAVTVQPNANASFQYQSSNLEVTFTNQSQNFANLLWDFGDGTQSTMQNPTHTYNDEGDYTVQLIAYSADCANDTVRQQLSVSERLTAGFQSSGQQACSPADISYSVTSTDATSIEWLFEGGNPAQSSASVVVVNYMNPGTYDVQLIVANATESDTLFIPDYITILPDPTAMFQFQRTGRTVNFTNQSTDFDELLWQFGDGVESRDTSPSHTYAQDSSYRVTLYAINECDTVSYDEQIDVFTPPMADFTVTSRSACAPLEVQFTNTSSENSFSYEWQFPGGTPSSSTEENPTIRYEVAGSYDVEMIAISQGGRDTILRQQYITILPDPKAQFSLERDSLTVTFTDQSQFADSIWWDFGDGTGSNEAMPTHTYDSSGTYVVHLYAVNQCDTDQYTLELGVGAIPSAIFSVSDTAIGCTPYTVQFFDQSEGNVTERLWIFEGGTPDTSSDTNPIVTYTKAGTFDVSYTVRNEFGQSTNQWTDYISVIERAKGSFTYEFVGSREIAFDGNLEGDPSASLRWDFGDGNTSMLEDVTHQYEEDDTYQVSFITWNMCSVDTHRQSIVVDLTSSDWNEMTTVTLYPNPAYQDVIIEGIPEAAVIEIRSITGGVMHRIPSARSRERISLFSWPKGTYLVQVKSISSGQTKSIKLLIQ